MSKDLGAFVYCWVDVMSCGELGAEDLFILKFCYCYHWGFSSSHCDRCFIVMITLHQTIPYHTTMLHKCYISMQVTATSLLICHASAGCTAVRVCFFTLELCWASSALFLHF